jgi:hypothetical protein
LFFFFFFFFFLKKLLLYIYIQGCVIGHTICQSMIGCNVNSWILSKMNDRDTTLAKHNFLLCSLFLKIKIKNKKYFFFEVITHLMWSFFLFDTLSLSLSFNFFK